MVNQTNDSMQASFEGESIPVHFMRRAWMENSGLTNVALSKRFDVSPSRISTIMRKGQCPQCYIDILRYEYKMPEELLPVRSREKTGPRPKKA
ncbi:MAG: hypothetical protein BA863_07470 [Desulfovibrio sp. S3730MH75]|nr:MAG: hypothetical protein BA863_07470 [Desulfovibrio sp. S3730MH75]